MFPIWDVHDTVVGFTGRVLVETEHSGGKYVNTPQGPVYDKSRVVFGLNKAKQEIKAKDLIVMVEGQMDVIACHQSGMTNVVATSGTALTDEQVKLLKRYSLNIAIAFDADTAGESAAKRGIDVALREGMNIRVIQIPEGAGKDPDECVKKNKQVWVDAVLGARDIMSWYFERAFRGKNVSDPKQKQQIASALLAEIGKIPYAVERDHWLQELGRRLGVDIAVLREDLVRVKEPGSVRTAPGRQGIDRVEVKAVDVPVTRINLLIERFVALLLRFPQLLVTSYELPVTRTLSPSPYLSLYETLKNQYTHGALDLQHVKSMFEHEGSENPVDILLMRGEKDFYDYTEDKAQKELEYICREIKEEWSRARGHELQIEIEAAEHTGDKERMSVLLDELQQLFSA